MSDNNYGITHYLTQPDFGQNQTLMYEFCAIFAIAELAIAKANDAPWLIEDKLNKRRTAYEFDKHLQNLLLLSNGHNGLSANCIECGKSNMYKTEVVLDGKFYFHFQQSFNPEAAYNKKYLDMNTDDSSSEYAYFLYSLSKNKDNVKSLKLVLPNYDKSKIKDYELTNTFEPVRRHLMNRNTSVVALLEELNWKKLNE